MTTALNHASHYKARTAPGGGRSMEAVDYAGLSRTLGGAANGVQSATFADGTTASAQAAPDPRFGLFGGYQASQSTSTPGGLQKTMTASRAAVSSPGDLLSLTSSTDTIVENGRTSTSAFDGVNRITTETLPSGRQRLTTLDVQGRPILVHIAGLDDVATSYDNRGRVSQIAQGSRVTTLAYDAQGRLASMTDPLNRTTSYQYDAAGRTTRETLPDGRVIDHAYDANGNETSLTPPGRPSHGFNYTPADQESQYAPPSLGMGTWSTTATYDAERKPLVTTRPDAATLTRGYDAAGRLSTLTVAGGAGGTIGYAYHAQKGTISEVSASGGSTLQLAYDGPLVTDTSWVGAVAGSLHFVYDNDFRVTSESVNGGNTITYGRDLDGLLTTAGALTLTRSAQHGLLTSTTLGNVTDAITYNPFGEPATYEAQYSGAAQFATQYTRDALGRITQKVETLLGVTQTYDYIYDLGGRLTEVKLNGATAATYAYDANSNRMSKVAGGVVTNGTYDDQDRLLSYGTAAYSYTANGERTSKTDAGQTTTYSYDALGNLKQVVLPGGPTIDYIVDGQHRRIGRKVNGALTQGFLYSSSLRVAAELDSQGAVASRFIYADSANSPEYMVKAGATYRLVTDHLGSPRLVINTATGAIAQRLDYDEFGNVTNDTNPGFQPFGFAGGLYDIDTKLVRFGARDYDPVCGRWTAKDPIRFAGGDSNIYGYVLADPINKFDPSGLFDTTAGSLWPAAFTPWLGPLITKAIPIVAPAVAGLCLAIVVTIPSDSPPPPPKCFFAREVYYGGPTKTCWYQGVGNMFTFPQWKDKPCPPIDPVTCMVDTTGLPGSK